MSEDELEKAIETNDVDKVKQLIKTIEANKRSLGDVLWDAIKKENVEIVKLLIEAGANIGPLSPSGLTAMDGLSALHYAIYSDSDVEIVKLLIEAGANVNAWSQKGRPLDYALKSLQHSSCKHARYKARKNVRLLIENGANINSDNKLILKKYKLDKEYKWYELCYEYLQNITLSVLIVIIFIILFLSIYFLSICFDFLDMYLSSISLPFFKSFFKFDNNDLLYLIKLKR